MTMVNNSEYNVSKACRSVDTASTSNREPRRYTAYEVHVHVVVRTRDKTLDPSKVQTDHLQKANRTCIREGSRSILNPEKSDTTILKCHMFLPK